MAGLHGTRPKENQRHIARVNRAMRPVRRNISDLARRQFGSAGRAVFLFEQNKAAAGQSLIGLGVIALAVVMAAREVIFRSHLSRINNCRAKEDISFRLTLIKGIVLVTERIIFLANASLQICRIEKKSSEIRKTFLIMSRGLSNYTCVRRNAYRARQGRAFLVHVCVKCSQI